MSSSSTVWQELFPAPKSVENQHTVLRMREISKQGRPLLLLPEEWPTTRAALTLYPAQKLRAHVARMLVRLLLQFRLGRTLRQVDLKVSCSDPFNRFLGRHSGTTTAPCMAVLAGNPAAEGRRFMVLARSPKHGEFFVAKTGVTSAARALITREAQVLRHVSEARIPHTPALLAEHEDERVSSFVTRFVSGRSPALWERCRLAQILSSWVRRAETCVVDSSACWQALEKAASSHPGFDECRKPLAKLKLACTLQHGDLAPWNIKIDGSGTWTVLDWERGDFSGLPAWDWFHYELQTAILVEMQPVPKLLAKIEILLRSEPFLEYAHLAGLRGFERHWLLAYLLFLVHVLRPTEGAPSAVELLGQFKP